MALTTAIPALRLHALSAPQPARLSRLSRLASLDFVVALGLAIAGLALAMTHTWSHATIGHAQYGDAAYWDLAGESWARGYVSTKIPDIRPGYSVFLGAVYSLFGADFKYGLAAQALLYAAGCCMVYLIGKRIGGRLAGLMAGLLFVIDPFMWQWTATSTTELVGSIANLGAVYCLVQVFSSRHRYLYGGLSGLLLAAANTVRPLTLGFIMPAALLLLWAVRCRIRTRFGVAAAALVLFGLGLLPGTLYQLRSTGQASLSSNGWANLFAASSPKYKTWTPAIEQDAIAQLNARGLAPTPENSSRVYRDMTIQNYLTYPGFQVSRLATGFLNFGLFEGQLDWNDQSGYGGFIRPLIALACVALGVFTFRSASDHGRERVVFAVTAAIAAASVALSAKLSPDVFALLQTLAICLAAAVLVRRTRANAALAAVALFWLSTGFLAIISTGVEGFFMNRMYTQVEPARAILLGICLAWLTGRMVRLRVARSRRLQLAASVSWMPDLRAVRRYGSATIAAVLAALALAGVARLALTNLSPPPQLSAYVAPTSAQLADTATRLHLPGTLDYVTPQEFAALYPDLLSGKPEISGTSYAFPGQFTRFLWDLPDINRTAFWYVYSEGPRPPALDRDLLTAEVTGVLRDQNFANRQGLLVVSPTGPYWDGTGELRLQNLLMVRAFIPTDASGRAFDLNTPTIFSLATSLYNTPRLQTAQITGQVQPSGLERVKLGDLNLPALRFTLAPVEPGTTPKSPQITFPNVLIPSNGRFEAWISIHPRYYMHPQLRQLQFEFGVNVDGRDQVLGQQYLSSMDEPLYRQFEVDLSQYAGQRVTVFLRATQAEQAREMAVVLVGDPRIVMPH